MDLKPGPKQIISTFGFIDEVGLLHTPKEDRIFGLGLLKTRNSQLHRDVVAYKNRIKFHEEFKFSNVRSQNLKQYKGFIDLFFNCQHLQFDSLIFDKTLLDIPTYFHSNYYKAYNSFVSALIAKSLEKNENIVVLADDVSTPKHDHFEKEIKEKVKDKMRRNALFGICRMESHAISELQVVDVLLGTVAYSFKIKYGLIKPSRSNAKFKLMKYLQKLLNTDKLAEDSNYRLRFGKRFTIREFKGKIKK